MWVASLAVLTLILGILVGWYARDVRDKVQAIYGLYRERLETPPGVVKPIVTKGKNRAQQRAAIDLGYDEDDDEGGAVLRPTPREAEALAELGEDSIIAAKKIQRERVKRL